MTTTYVLVADARRARVLRTTGPGDPLVPALPADLVGNAAPSREIASDRPGRVFDSHGPGRHAAEEPTDPRRYEAMRFAREIVHALDAARKEGAFERLAIIAPPAMLGDLRAAMPSALRALVSVEVDKDLSKLPVHELTERVQDLLRP